MEAIAIAIYFLSSRHRTKSLDLGDYAVVDAVTIIINFILLLRFLFLVFI